MDGKIDMIITKSIPRFARNTLDTLRYVRLLREKNVAIYFEVEKINTLVDGEFLMTILSSVAQQEVENTSAYVKKGLKMKMKRGELVGFSRCFGYDRDKETGELKIVESEAETVRHIFDRYLQGAGGTVIARELNEEGILTYNHCQWTCSIILNIIKNEKYMGDAILQKTYTSDFLTKKTEKNTGQITQYYVENDHEPIIEKDFWNAVQMEVQRRKEFMETHNLRTMGRYTDEQPFSSRVLCGTCGTIFWRRTLTRNGKRTKVWMCSQRYRQKGVVGCSSETLKEEALHNTFIKAWNGIIENRSKYVERWKNDMRGDNPLLAFRAKQMLELTKGKPMKKIDMALVGKVLERCVVLSSEVMEIYFLDGTCVKIA